MKVLTDDQQLELLVFFKELQESDLMPNPDFSGPINYWAMELKPKRVRKKGLDITVEV